MGKINPFTAPAMISSCTGLPMKRKMTVEVMIKSETIHLLYLSITGCSVLKKEMEVYEAPTTEVMAAHHMTKPKNRYPISPAANWNTEPAGLLPPSLPPCHTTPN